MRPLYRNLRYTGTDIFVTYPRWLAALLPRKSTLTERSNLPLILWRTVPLFRPCAHGGVSYQFGDGRQKHALAIICDVDFYIHSLNLLTNRSCFDVRRSLHGTQLSFSGYLKHKKTMKKNSPVRVPISAGLPSCLSGTVPGFAMREYSERLDRVRRKWPESSRAG